MASNEAAPRRGGLVHHRDFRLLWAGQSTSDVGTAVSGVVVPLIAVVYLHATAFEVGALAGAAWLPWLLIGLPAGVWVDRSRCRPLLIGCDVVRAVLIGSIPLAAAFGVLGIAQLFAVSLLTGLATVLFQIAYLSYLPSLLERERLIEANAKLQGSGAVALVVGPGLGGLLVQLMRAPFALIVDAASYVVSVAALLAIRAREPRREVVEQRNLRREIAEGARYVFADPILRVLTISPAVGNFFFTAYEGISVLFLVRTVHLAPASVGLLVGVASLGAVLGAAIARPLARMLGTSRAVWLVMMLTAPFALLVPLTSRGLGLGCYVVGSVVVFTGVLVYNVNIGSFRQAYCPPRILGRVVASMRFVLFGTMPLGALAGGALAESLGVREAMWALTGGSVVPVFILLASPLRGMRDLPDAPVAGAILTGDTAGMPHT